MKNFKSTPYKIQKIYLVGTSCLKFASEGNAQGSAGTHVAFPSLKCVSMIM